MWCKVTANSLEIYPLGTALFGREQLHRASCNAHPPEVVAIDHYWSASKALLVRSESTIASWAKQ